MKLLKWLIKMAKKILNLDTDTGALSFEDSASLPSGTVNKLLRHNGTDWVSTVNSTLTDGDASNTLLLKNSDSAGRYIRANVTNTNSTLFDVQTSDLNRCYMFVGSSYSEMRISYGGSPAIMQTKINNDNQYITLSPSSNSSSQRILIQTTKTYSATSKFLEFYGRFDIYQNGKIVSSYLSGTGSALLEAASDGTIQRSTATLPTRTEYLSGLLTGTEHTFTGATLGITGDLRSRIKNIKCFAVDSSGNFNGALIDNEFIYETDLVVNSATNLSGSFSIKLFIEYV